MKSKKPLIHPRAVVWRISEGAPLGEWVDRSAPPPRIQKTGLPEVANDSWVTSSHDLLDGIEISEDGDTIPGDLLDELFDPRKPAAGK